ncbi:MAG: hypothetical protein M3249_02240 [Thermoproteota archaeon]|nr:hypothetical protein [Thermoproteota archaeon]
MVVFTPVVIVLLAISIVGALAIPFGDPQFLDRAIALELSFITLAIVLLLDVRGAVKKVPLCKLALYACIPLAVIIMVGNSLAPPHIEIMRTFSKPFNALLLIIGGYILQAALIGTTVMQLARTRLAIVQKQNN